MRRIAISATPVSCRKQTEPAPSSKANRQSSPDQLLPSLRLAAAKTGAGPRCMARPWVSGGEPISPAWSHV